MDTKQGQNSIIEYLKARDPELMDKVVSTFATCRKLDFMSIKQSDIMVLTPEQAYEYKGNEGDKYFKIWMAGDKIAWCTWANSMIDSRFRWNSKETDPEKQRDNTDILGNEPYVSEFIKSWSARKKCTTVYMFPLFRNKAHNKKPEKGQTYSCNREKGKGKYRKKLRAENRKTYRQSVRAVQIHSRRP